MSEQNAAAAAPVPFPVIRTITFADVREALRLGVEDMRAAPFYSLLFGAIYALGGIMLTLMMTRLGMGYLVYPLLAGFVLIGPFVAIGLYEISRRRERGLPIDSSIFSVLWQQGGKEIGWMSFTSLFLMTIWLYQVRLLIALFLGYHSFTTFAEFLNVVFSTPEGWTFLAVGHLVGAALSVLLFSLTVISFPLLLDRDVDFITAMIASVQSVMKNPGVMLGWALMIVVLLVIGMAPFFLGLLIILPILGHASWHLYRRVIAPLETASP